MKYLILLEDGMADLAVPELNGKTPMDVAKKPHTDALSKQSTVGMVKTVPDHLPAGSDVANLSVFGYDPERYYSGRSPLEAVSIGVPLSLSDVSFRMNLVTLSDDEPFDQKRMIDYSAGEIETPVAHELVNYLAEHLSTDTMKLYPGFSYRHCVVIENGETGTTFTPPHDISDQPITGHLPEGRYGELFGEMTRRAYELLREHPVNKQRVAEGRNPANCIWLWGEGVKPALDSYEEKFGVKGAVISAVDLLKGIGHCAGLRVIEVEGATGTLHTNYSGKAQAAIDALLKDGLDFVYLHIEAPDECGHQHDVAGKVRSIELIDELVLAPVLAALRASGEEFRILIMPDHPTPLTLRTHTHDPIPFLLYDSTMAVHGPDIYCERTAAGTGLFVPRGCEMAVRLFAPKK